MKNKKLKVRIQLLPGAKMPKKGSDDAACYDAYAHTVEKVNELEVKIGLGFKTEIPSGWKGIVVPRSSFTKTAGIIQNSPAQIDPDYRGEWKARIKYLYADDIPEPGDRVVQFYFEKINEVEFEEVNSLSETKRGDGGFGSTGKN